MNKLMSDLTEQIERIQSVIDNNRKPIPFDKLGAWDRRCWNRDHTGKDDVFVNETDYNNAPFQYNIGRRRANRNTRPPRGVQRKVASYRLTA